METPRKAAGKLLYIWGNYPLWLLSDGDELDGEGNHIFYWRGMA
jgi:hypothetical protein